MRYPSRLAGRASEFFPQRRRPSLEVADVALAALLDAQDALDEPE